MVFGAALTIAGVVLFATKPSEGETSAKILGVEVTVKTPSIVILVLGCLIFLSPFLPFFSGNEVGPSPTPTAPVTATATGSPSPEAGKTISPVSELHAAPVALDVAEDGSVWVALTEQASGPGLVRLEPSTLQVNPPVPFRGLPVSVVAEAPYVWVLTMEGLLRFDPTSSQFAAPVPLGGRPSKAYPTSGSLWILLPNNDAVVRVDTETTETARIRVGDDPQFIAFAAGKMWVASVDKTITAISPSDNVATPATRLSAAPVAMINFRGGLLVATADGRVVTVDPHDPASPVEIADVSPGETHLISADDHAWAWQEGNSLLWRIDSTGGPERSLPFGAEKLARLGDVLWAVAVDGSIAEIDADDASLLPGDGAIDDRPKLLARDEEHGRLLLVAYDGSVYQLPPDA
jgi:hypothetical protein